MKALLLVLSLLLVGTNHQPPLEDGFSTPAANSAFTILKMPEWLSVDNGIEQDLAPAPATQYLPPHLYLQFSFLPPPHLDARRPVSAGNAIRGPPASS